MIHKWIWNCLKLKVNKEIVRELDCGCHFHHQCTFIFLFFTFQNPKPFCMQCLIWNVKIVCVKVLIVGLSKIHFVPTARNHMCYALLPKRWLGWIVAIRFKVMWAIPAQPAAYTLTPYSTFFTILFKDPNLNDGFSSYFRTFFVYRFSGRESPALPTWSPDFDQFFLERSRGQSPAFSEASDYGSLGEALRSVELPIVSEVSSRES